MAKKVIRLNESDLHTMIKEAVNQILLKEGGNLYGTFDDSTKFTNSNTKWRGVDGTTYIWHGEWSDPEVWYDDKEINYNDLEDYMWVEYKNDCEEEGKEPTEQEYDNLPTEWFAERLDYFIYDYFGEQ